MSKIIISVEAAADLNDDIISQYGFAVAPMNYIVDGKAASTLDGVDLSAFYQAMRDGAKTHTSQVNPDAAYTHLESLLSEGASVLHLSMSSSLSGTYGNFVVAAKELEGKYGDKVKVVDSLSASGGITLIAIACAIKAQEGCTLDELYDFAEQQRHDTSALFTVDSLTYLARTGRISKAAALLGNAISLKVALHVSPEGALVPHKKVLSRKRALNAIIDSAVKMYVPKLDKVLISYADCEQDAQFVAQRLTEELKVEVTTVYLGPVIGCHSGPGTLAVFFTSDTKKVIL